MKKTKDIVHIILYFLLSTLVCGLICFYCNNYKTVQVIKNDITTEITTEQVTSDNRDEDGKDGSVYVKYSFIDEMGLPHIIIKNNSEQIYGYDLTVEYFDSDKQLINNEELHIDAVVPSGLTDGLDRFIPVVEGAVYVSADIISVDYLDGKTVLQQNKKSELLTMKDFSPKQVNADCNFIGIDNISIVKSDSSLSDLRFSIVNKGNRAIKSMEFIIAEFDKDNNPVSAKPNSYVKENIRKLNWKSADLQPNSAKTLASSMVLNGKCTKIEIIVYNVEFSDKHVWKNTDALEWILQGGK